LSITFATELWLEKFVLKRKLSRTFWSIIRRVIALWCVLMLTIILTIFMSRFLPNRALYYLGHTYHETHNTIWLLDTFSGVRYRVVQRSELAAFDLSPDGRTIVYQAGMGEDARLYLFSLDTVLHEEIAAVNVECPRFSPDGTTLLYQDYHEFTLHFLDLASRESTFFLYLGAGIARCSHDWTADGTAIICSHWLRPLDIPQLVQTDIATQEITSITSVQRPVRQMTVSPDGQYITYTANAQPYAIMLNLTNGDIQYLTYYAYTFSAAWSATQDYIAFGYQKPLLRAADGIQRGIALINANGEILFEEDIGTVSHIIWWVGR
jgi:Tol biopolymer transport system component